MKSKKSWLIVFILLGLLLFMAVAVGIAFFWFAGESVTISDHTVLTVEMGGTLREVRSDNPLARLFQEDELTLWELWQLLDYSARDDRISALYLEIKPLAYSWAQIEELRDSLHHFRDSGKPVHAFAAVDIITERELYLASAADTITVNPESTLLINGLVAEVTFFKNTLDRLAIKPEFIQFKEYKSAEEYSRQEMSPAIRELYTSILSDLQERLISTIASERNMDRPRLQTLVNDGILTARDAVQAGVIDRAGYRSEVLQQFKEEVAADHKDVKASDYLGASRSRFETTSPNKVALVTGTGIITSGQSDPFSETLGGSSLARQLREIRENKNFKAVLLRVDSPGGSAVGSDMVWKEIVLLEEAGKPVIASMSGVAGSGGYYISMGAREIISQPSTITGSIGVIFGKFDIEGLLNLLGMTVDRVKMAPNADLFSVFSSFTDEQKAAVTELIRQTYVDFVTKAAEGRGTTYEEMENKARGRIYTGSQAQELGLVDDIGGFTTAVSHLKTALNLGDQEEIQLVLYPRPKTLFELLTSSSSIRSDPQLTIRNWLAREMNDLTQAAPRLLMPQAKIY